MLCNINCDALISFIVYSLPFLLLHKMKQSLLDSYNATKIHIVQMPVIVVRNK